MLKKLFSLFSANFFIYTILLVYPLQAKTIAADEIPTKTYQDQEGVESNKDDEDSKSEKKLKKKKKKKKHKKSIAEKNNLSNEVQSQGDKENIDLDSNTVLPEDAAKNTPYSKSKVNRYQDDEDEAAEEKSSKKLKKIKFKGNVKFSVRYLKNRAQESENSTGFELTAVNLKLEYKYSKSAQLKIHYQIDPLQFDLKYAYIRLGDNTAFVDELRMGYQSRILSLESEMETDSLNKIALDQMHDLSMQATVNFLERFRFVTSLSNGSLVDTKDISPRRVSKQDVIVADAFDEKQASGSNSTELAIAFGYSRNNHLLTLRYPQFHSISWDVLFFGSVAALSDESPGLDNLAEIPQYTGINQGGTSYENTKSGVNFIFDINRLHIANQFAKVRIRKFDRNFMATEWSYSFNRWKPLIAYSVQNLNIKPSPFSPISWGRRRLTLGGRFHWFEQADIVCEITKNEEDTGGKSINNDEALLMWVYQF